MKPKVVVYKKMDPKVLDYIREHCEVTYFEQLKADNEQEFKAALKEAVGLLGAGLKVDAVLLDQAPELKIVCNTSVGYDNLDMPELNKRGIMATNTPDVLNETVADAVFGLILAAARRIPELDRAVREGKWKGSVDESWYGIDVHHKTLGIIGMGGIGAAIARRARHGFGMNVLYHNRNRKPEYEDQFGAVYCSMEELLQQSDYVCLMTPLTPSTKNLMGEREFQLMKRSAVFINASRGATVDEEALISALRQGEIRAAGLDVFVQEPVSTDNPLLHMDQVVVLPHIGSATYETRYEMAMLGARNLVFGITGKIPPTLIKGNAFIKG